MTLVTDLFCIKSLKCRKSVLGMHTVVIGSWSRESFQSVKTQTRKEKKKQFNDQPHSFIGDKK